MITEWVTAIAATATAIAGVVAMGISIWKIKVNKRKNRSEVLRKLSRYMYWLDESEKLLKRIFSAANDNLTVNEVMENTRMYMPVREPLASDLEKISNKAGYGLSKDQEKEIESFCGVIIRFTYLYDFLKESMFEKENAELQFCDMKVRLKKECPKEMVYDVEKTEDSEFSECIFAHIIKLKKQWNEVEKYLEG